jgi:hypothetical protein
MATITIKRLSVTTAASIFLSLLITGKAEAFTFTKIADDSGPFSFVNVSFGARPVINNRGTVAFLTNLDTGDEGIFTGSGGATTTIAIADDSGPSGTFGLFQSPPALNDEGTVAFTAFLSTGVPRGFFGGGLFTNNGGLTTFIADSNLQLVPFLGGPAINNEGTIAITAPLPGGLGSGIFTVSGGATTLIAALIDDRSGPFSGFGGLAINDAGTVAFLVSQDEGRGLFTTSGGAITTIADSSGPFGYLGGLAINNAGTLAFSAFRDFQDFLEGGGGGGIFTSSGGVTTIIADNTGPFRTFSGLAINDAGTVAFLASLDEGGSGIFTGPNPVTDKVIATGDSLFNSTVTSFGFGFGSKGLNNAGQLTFFAQLADGSSGIFRADPESTPNPQPVSEPASVLDLLAVGALGIGTWWKRQQRRTS